MNKADVVHESESATLGVLGSVNERSNVAVYQQIENIILFAIASGLLEPKDKLPSVRQVAETLKMNPNTIAKAYRDLEVRGIVMTRRGTGVFINAGAKSKTEKRAREIIYGKLAEAVGEAKLAGLSATEVKKKVGECFGAEYVGYQEAPKTVVR